MAIRTIDRTEGSLGGPKGTATLRSSKYYNRKQGSLWDNKRTQRGNHARPFEWPQSGQVFLRRCLFVLLSSFLVMLLFRIHIPIFLVQSITALNAIFTAFRLPL